MVPDLEVVAENSDMRFGRLCYDPKGCAERALWQAVLLSMVHDLCIKGRFSTARREAETWVGEYPTRHFKLVCLLAGFDDEAVWDRLSALRKQAPEDRYWPRGFSKSILQEDAHSRDYASMEAA